jgi:4-amino-4-deoxy-L-arabinose transferase-like glycosyltransferase
LLAFALRAANVARFVFHEDEFYSMLAVSQTLERGVPILPSGLFYDKGLAYTYLTAFLARSVGFGTALARWPSVLAGVLSIAAMFAAGRALYGVALAGFLAAIAVAFDGDAIAWSSRARMYTMAQMALPLLFLVTWRIANIPRGRDLLVALGLMAWALLAHSGTAVLIPPLVLATAFVLWKGRRLPRLWSALSWPLILLTVVVAALALGLILGGSATELPARVVPDDPNLPLDFDSTAEPIGETLAEFIDFFTQGSRLIYSLLALGAGLWAMYRVLLAGSAHADEYAALFVAGLVFATFVIVLALPSKEFKRDRNLFLLLVPQIYLLSGVGFCWLVRGVGRFVNYQWAASGLVILALVGLAYPSLSFLKPAEGKARYDTAYALVKANWQPGDTVMAARTASCYLFLGRCDYYLREFGVRATDKFTGNYADWYVGAPWLARQADFNRILASEERVWFVVRESQLTGNFTADFIQQILAQMRLEHQAGDVLVFRSVSDPLPLPEVPDYAADWQWEGGVRLVGYSVTPLDADSLSLTLFWQDIPPATDLKVFVHLRSPEGVNLLQADRVPLEALPDNLRQAAWGAGSLVRDRVIISLGPGVDLTQDRFIVGIYHPQSGQRLPLMNDQSGENGVWLDEIR